MENLLWIFVSALLVNNFVLSRFLGICPFLGVSKKMDTAVGMSGAVIFVMTLAAMITWVVSPNELPPAFSGFDQVVSPSDTTSPHFWCHCALSTLAAKLSASSFSAVSISLPADSVSPMARSVSPAASRTVRSSGWSATAFCIRARAEL